MDGISSPDAKVDAALSSIPARLIHHASTRGAEAAFHVIGGDAEATLTWADLLHQSAEYADRFLASGVRPGEVVPICLRHGPSLYPAYLGAMLAGAIPSFLAFPTPKQDPVLYWGDQRALFGRVQPPVVLTYVENARELADVLPATTSLLVDEPLLGTGSSSVGDVATRFPPPALDAVALLQHSSGTTGQKKGVMLTHRIIALQAVRYAGALALRAEHRVASWLPLYHDMGLVAAFLIPVHLGASVVSLDAFEWVADPHSLLDVMDRHRCDYVWQPTFAYNHLVRTKQSGETYRLEHVRAFICSAEPCKPDVLDRFVEAFAPHGVGATQMQTMYGMAETVLATSQSRLGRPVRRLWFDASHLAAGRAVHSPPGPCAVEYLSNGPPLDGLELRVDPAATAKTGLGPGTAVGELQVRGNLLFDGYYRNSEATSEAFADGWYRTGDLGCMIDGEAFVLGRLKDVIIHHGVNYYAHDLEAAAATVAGVKPGRCAALAVFDDATSSERIELIAEREFVDEENDVDLRAQIKQAIADRFQVTVARVHLVDPGWVIKTTSGKVSRHENLIKLQQSLPDGQREPSGPPAGLYRQVVDTIASTFSVPADVISAETTAADVEGWDSLGHTVLMLRLERALGTDVPESIAANSACVGQLVALLGEHLGRPA
jgi:fatty-acyl-CoA synthase